MAVLVDLKHLARGGRDLRRPQVIARQPRPVRVEADPAAEYQAADTRLRGMSRREG